MSTVTSRPSQSAPDWRSFAAQEFAPGVQDYYDDPIGFVNDCVAGCDLAHYQTEALAALSKQERVSIRGPHGLGKTTITALAILWFALTRDGLGLDWKAATTAGGWRQLERYLWPEIHKWARLLRWERLGRSPLRRDELLTLNLKLAHGQAFAVASDDPGLIEGVHADEVLYVFDEAKAIPAATFDAAEGAFAASGAGDKRAFGLVTSTPGEPAGRFYEIQAKRPGFEDWWSRHVTMAEAVDAGRMSESWVDQRRLQWGKDSAVFQNRVLGDFATAEDGVIPLAWAEAAIERWHEWREGLKGTAKVTRLGVDVSRSGEDRTCLALRSGDVVAELRYSHHEDTMSTTGRVMGVLTAHPGSVAVVDTDGLGAGVTDRLREQDAQVEAFHAAARSELRDKSGELGMINCLAGDAEIAPIGELQRVYRSWHDGPLFRIKMASGDEFTATPNHNVLTPEGWVAVQALGVGDYLTSALGSDSGDPTVPDIDQVPAKVSEIYRTARRLWGAERVPALGVDFHGDRPVGQVDVVTVNGHLFGIDEPRRQEISQATFRGLLHRTSVLSSLGSASLVVGEGHFQSGSLSDDHRMVGAGRIVTDAHSESSSLLQLVGLANVPKGDSRFLQLPGDPRFMGVHRNRNEFHALASQIPVDDGRNVQRVQRIKGFRPTAPWNPPLTEYASQDGAVVAKCLANRSLGLTSQIATDQVLSIEVLNEGTHVFTVQCSSGAYRSSSVVHKNCRAAAWWQLRELLDPSSGTEIALPDDDTLIGDLTSPRWRVVSGSKVQIEDKPTIKKRLGRSTDAGDAVAMAFYSVPIRKGTRMRFRG